MKKKPTEQEGGIAVRGDAPCDNQSDAAVKPNPVTELKIPDSIIDECRRYQKEQRRENRISVWIGVGTLFVIFCYTAIAGYQGYKMREATEASQISATAAARAAKTAEDAFKYGEESFKATMGEMEKQSVAMKTLADANKEIVELSQKTFNANFIANKRPWLSVDASIGSDLKFTQGGATISVILNVKNWGNSPAMNVSYTARIFLWDTTAPRTVFDKAEEIFNKPIKRSLTPDSQYGYVIFPGQDVSEKTEFTISREDIDVMRARLNAQYDAHEAQARSRGASSEQFWRTFRDSRKNELHPFFVACISYEFAFDNSIHKTGLFARIHRVDSQQTGIWAFDISGKDVPANSIKIAPWYFPRKTD